MTHESRPKAAHRGAGRRAADGTSAPVSVADGTRIALEVAGIDREPLGIRDVGALNWTPDPVPDEGPAEPPVAIARRRVLARKRREHLERQLTLARRFLAEFGDAV